MWNSGFVRFNFTVADFTIAAFTIVSVCRMYDSVRFVLEETTRDVPCITKIANGGLTKIFSSWILILYLTWWFFRLSFRLFSFDFRVLKPPGGGSSDIFGAAPEETSPRRIKAHNQSQLGSALFGDINGTDNANAAVSPRSSKPGNDSYNRLFGPPDVPPTTPNARNHMRSNIPLSGGSSISSLSSGTATSPAKSTVSSSKSSGIANGYASNGSNSFNDITGKGPWRTRKR